MAVGIALGNAQPVEAGVSDLKKNPRSVAKAVSGVQIIHRDERIDGQPFFTHVVTARGIDPGAMHDAAYRAFVSDLETKARSFPIRFSGFSLVVRNTPVPGHPLLCELRYGVRIQEAGDLPPHRVVDMRWAIWREAGKARIKAQKRALKVLRKWEPKMRAKYVITDRETDHSGGDDFYHTAVMLYGVKAR